MSIDRAKVLEAAQKYLAKGQLDKAIGEYRKLMQDDPKDARTLLKIGDIYTRKGDMRGATAAYGQVAEHYADQGFFLKAVAVYKQILKLDPNQLPAWEKLAEMYELLSLTNDALTTYDQLAAVYTRANDSARALNALSKMVELDPENVPATIKYAEALSRAGRSEEAADAFEQGALRLKDQGRMDDYIKVAERLLFHRPADAVLAHELAGLYLERGDAKHALAKLQVCFKASPKDIPTLQLLAEAFHLLGQQAKTISVYEEVARLHADAGRDHQRRAILRRILELDPNHALARAEVGRHDSMRPATRSMMPSTAVITADSQAMSEPPPLADLPDDDFDPLASYDSHVGMAPSDDFDPAGDFAPESSVDELTTGEMEPFEAARGEDVSFDDDLVFADDVLEAVPVPTRGSQPGGGGVGEPAADDAQIARMLKECEVFTRYGLHDKVIAQADRVLDIAPDHVQARLLMKDAFIALGKVDDAVLQLLLVADNLGETDPQMASELLTEAIRLDPGNDVARAQLQSLRLSIVPAPPEEGSGAFEVFEDELEDDSPTGRRSVSPQVQRATAVPDAFDDFGSLDDAEDVAALEIDADDLESADDEPATGLFPARVSQISEAPPAVAVEPFTDDPAKFTQGAAGHEQDADEGDEDLPEEVSDALEEVDFYLAQGMTDEARDVLTDALANHPESAALQRKLRALEGDTASAQPAVSEEDHSFALAEKLAQSGDADRVAGSGGGDEPVDVQDVLAQFKQGVSKQVDPKDAATHYDLGIAYTEMGLHDDAIAEFTLCLTSESHVCTAHTMIGLSYVAKGDWRSSIEHFKSALAVPHSDRDELGLWFELGNANELLGQTAEARDYYGKVHAVDPSFRDVEARLARIQTPAAKDEGDEFDSLFDNMIMKD